MTTGINRLLFLNAYADNNPQGTNQCLTKSLPIHLFFLTTFILKHYFNSRINWNASAAL